MRKIRFKDYLIDYLKYNHITNKDFSNRLGITPKHLIDILSGNRDISSQLIEKISLVTNIPADYIYRIESNYKLEQEIEDYLKKENLTATKFLNRFHYQYLIKAKFLEFVDIENKMDMIKDILKFLRVPNPQKIYEIDKSAYYKSKNDKKELLLLWLEKCYREALKQNVGVYEKSSVDKLVEYIVENAKLGIFDEKKLISEFNQYGIYLVIADDIPGSKIRGAFKVHRGIPAIYLTHKHKRIADIYFALLHELAHCKSDFNKAKASSLVSYEQELDEIETKRDYQAYNWMVDEKYYQTVCCSKNYNIMTETKYPKCFVLYRLANDKFISYGNLQYQKYNFRLQDKNAM